MTDEPHVHLSPAVRAQLNEDLRDLGAVPRARLADGALPIVTGDLVLWFGPQPTTPGWTTAGVDVWYRLARESDVSYDRQVAVLSPTELPEERSAAAPRRG